MYGRVSDGDCWKEKENRICVVRSRRFKDTSLKISLRLKSTRSVERNQFNCTGNDSIGKRKEKAKVKTVSLKFQQVQGQWRRSVEKKKNSFVVFCSLLNEEIFDSHENSLI